MAMSLLARAPTAACSVARRRPCRGRNRVVVAAAQAQKPKVTVLKAVDEQTLKARGVLSWPTWGCEVSKFPWTYQESETCYVTQGRVVVTPTGGEPVEVVAGDMATFPSGMSCVWDVKEAIEKHYNFH